MSQPNRSSVPTENNPELKAVIEGLIIGMGLRRFLDPKSDGLYLLRRGATSGPGQVYSLELGRKRSNSYTPVVSLSYRVEAGTYCLAASNLPRQLRQLREVLSPSSPAAVSHEQAMFAAYEMLAYLKRCG